MATVPLSGTSIRLLSGVPFSNDYKHTRWFDNEAQQLNYFASRNVVHSMSEANFQRIEGHAFIAVNRSIDELWGTNYLMFQNAQYNSKWFFAFVTRLEYVQKKTTYVHFEIDVFQTWRFEMNFKPSYVVREHCRLWNDDGSPVVNTIDEGLDYGTEYDFVNAQQYNPLNGIRFLVIVSKSTLHIADGLPTANYIKASMNGSAQPLCFYIHPFNELGEGIDTNIDGTTYVLNDVITAINILYTEESAVNNIVSMYITEHVGIDFTYDGSTLTANTNLLQELEVVNIEAPAAFLNTIYVKNVYAYSQSTISTKQKYLDFGGVYNGGWSFPDVEESKLLMYPYAFTILDDFKGNRVVLRNEYIDSDTIEVSVMGSMGLSNKVAYIPKNYLTQNIGSPVDQTLVAIEKAMIDNTPHDVSIINDMLAAFLQGNKNSLQNQANTIVFNGVVDTIGNVIGGIGSAVSGNGLGVAASGVNAVKGGGNAVLQLQGLQAKIKDINNQPPSLSKLGSNTAFEYGNLYTGFWVISKQIKPEYRKKLADFFKLYGYKVNEVKTPNFHTRQSWNYIQTISCHITGNFNNEDLQELKNIFDNGITLWHNDDVGNYLLPNGVIA